MIKRISTWFLRLLGIAALSIFASFIYVQSLDFLYYSEEYRYQEETIEDVAIKCQDMGYFVYEGVWYVCEHKVRS